MHGAAGRPLPRFPCMCKAIYSWGGETKRDLGFVEGDLIECLNAGDGQWWMGRLRRNKTVGLFPSNYVEVLENYERPGVLSRPVSRAGSPGGGDRGRKQRAHSPAPSHRGASPAPSHYSRAASPQPPAHSYYGHTVGGSSRSRTGRSPSPNPYQQSRIPRAASPNPYHRTASPAPSFGGHDPPRAVSPAPSHFRAVSPAPTLSHYQRAASPSPYGNGGVSDMSPPPPAPPPHRVNARTASPMPPPHSAHVTPIGSRAATPSNLQQTPSPLRTAMEDVMESLQHMTVHDDGPQTPQTPWGPESFEELYAPSPVKRHARPETSLGIAGRNEYEEVDDANGIPLYPEDPQQRTIAARNHEERLRRFELSTASQRRPSEDEMDMPPPVPAKYSSYNERTTHGERGDPVLRNRKSAYDLRASAQDRGSPTKMTRPRPLSRVGTLSSHTTSNHSSSTNTTSSTALTSASIMSGMSAGGFSATSAGSLARRKFRAQSVIEGGNMPPTRQLVSGFAVRSETPNGYLASVSSNSSGGQTHSRQRNNTWATAVGGGGLGGLTAPKPKKSGFFKKILNSAKTSAASVRSVADIPPSSVPSQFAPKTIPDGINAIAGGRASPLTHGGDWVQIRRDVNRANTLSRNERIERQEKQQMMDQLVLRPVDALDEDVDGDEAADGGVVETPQDFDTANLTLVDKSARFISSLPPFTTPESLASHHVCRPYRSDVQRLRAIFTWVSEKIAWEHPGGPVDGEFGEAGVDARRVLSQKRGSPEEVACVVQSMCTAVGIHCDVVRGFLKAPGEDVVLDSSPRPNHWWNAVVADGEWRFMDCSLASPTHPRRSMYSPAASSHAEFFYFLTKPSEFCWTHIPLQMEQQHMVPPLPPQILLALPCACPPFFRQRVQMINFDTSLIRMEDLEVVQIEFTVPNDVECVAEVEVKGFAVDQDGDVFETGDVVKKRALAQVAWENGIKTYRVKAVLVGDEGTGVLKIYAGKRGLMHSISNNPHPLAFALPIYHTGENPPFDFFLRHPTPHAQRHDLYITQPQCFKLAVNNTFVFAVRQSPSDGTNAVTISSTGSGNVSTAKPAKLGIQTPSGKILRLMKKAGTSSMGNKDGMVSQGVIWETIIKCGERGPWRALVLADRSARWCVYGEWVVV